MTETEDGGILIIEDDREIANVVSMNLSDLGLDIQQEYNGKTGLEKALSRNWALLILDVMLPGMDGIAVCRRIRETDPYTPILMLTARADELDRVLGLELGADDYMTKPFSVRELNARAKALLRRAKTVRPGFVQEPEDSDAAVRIGGLEMDFKMHKSRLNGRALELTVKEFELLSLFVRNPGRAYSRADLLNIVWGYNFEGYEHTVNTHINRLRNKIEDDPANPKYLQTVWGIGYRFTGAKEENE